MFETVFHGDILVVVPFLVGNMKCAMNIYFKAIHLKVLFNLFIKMLFIHLYY